MVPWWIMLIFFPPFILPLWLAIIVVTRNNNKLTNRCETLSQENFLLIQMNKQLPPIPTSDANEELYEDIRRMAGESREFAG